MNISPICLLSLFFIFSSTYFFHDHDQPIRDSKRLKETLDRIDNEAGLVNIAAVHLNDSLKDLGSRIDRHERIGEGRIGKSGFKAVVRHETFADTPGILETQPLPDSEYRYRPQIRLLKDLRGIVS